MAGTYRVPGYPRWTGVVAHIGETRTEGGQLTTAVQVRITRRARWYVRARLLLGKGVPRAAA